MGECEESIIIRNSLNDFQLDGLAHGAGGRNGIYSEWIHCDDDGDYIRLKEGRVKKTGLKWRGDLHT